MNLTKFTSNKKILSEVVVIDYNQLSLPPNFIFYFILRIIFFFFNVNHNAWNDIPLICWISYTSLTILKE